MEQAEQGITGRWVQTEARRSAVSGPEDGGDASTAARVDD